MYILKQLIKEFIKDFYKGPIQGYNGTTALVSRLQEEYIIPGLWTIARKVTKECPDCQRNKPVRYKLYKKL